MADLGNCLFAERKSCPICGSSSLSVLFSAPYTDRRVREHILSHYRNQGVVSFEPLEGVDYTILECLDCDLIFQKMVPTGRMLSIIYDQFIDQARLRELELSRLTVENFRAIARHLAVLFAAVDKSPAHIRFLDFGFGYGRWARVAVGMGAEVFATEISPEKIAFAASIGVKIIPEDALPDQRFDIIHTEQVFEHLTDPAGTFDKLARSLAENGIFKISVPKQGRIRDLLRHHGFIDWSPYEFDYKKKKFNNYDCIMPLEHLNAFSPRSIEHLARRAGLVARNGRHGSRYLDLDLGSVRSFFLSGLDWGKRIIKDIRAGIGPGLKETGYYIITR